MRRRGVLWPLILISVLAGAVVLPGIIRWGGKGGRLPVDRREPESERREAQRDLVERARPFPGVAEVMDVYGRLAPYTSAVVNVQPSQVRNGTGGNG
jgi:hypothetical protein